MRSSSTVVLSVFVALLATVVVIVSAQYCCDGTPIAGPCVNGLCPTSKMCTNGACCTCRDTCYDCHLYVANCNNSAYPCMACCAYTCGKCHY
uniref:Uncharacterized protein n=1 Tax=Panagrellus redivivus TaxID=6233 RepID=A0A7E4VUF5_PANRE